MGMGMGPVGGMTAPALTSNLMMLTTVGPPTNTNSMAPAQAMPMPSSMPSQPQPQPVFQQQSQPPAYRMQAPQIHPMPDNTSLGGGAALAPTAVPAIAPPSPARVEAPSPKKEEPAPAAVDGLYGYYIPVNGDDDDDERSEKKATASSYHLKGEDNQKSKFRREESSPRGNDHNYKQTYDPAPKSTPPPQPQYQPPPQQAPAPVQQAPAPSAYPMPQTQVPMVAPAPLPGSYGHAQPMPVGGGQNYHQEVAMYQSHNQDECCVIQ